MRDEGNRLERLEPYALTERFDEALSFAAKLHRRQARKGTHVPYLSHLLAVAALVIEDRGSEDEAIAALLQIPWRIKGAIIQVGARPFEFTSATGLGLQSPLSLTPARMTRDLPKGQERRRRRSESDGWNCKRKYTESIAHKTPQALRVTNGFAASGSAAAVTSRGCPRHRDIPPRGSADKVHNAESILDSHADYGAEVWKNFRTQSCQDQVYVYRTLYEAINARYEVINTRNKEFPANEKSHLPRRLLRVVDLMERLS